MYLLHIEGFFWDAHSLDSVGREGMAVVLVMGCRAALDEGRGRRNRIVRTR